MLLLGIPFLPIQTEILISPDFHRGFFFFPSELRSHCSSKEERFHSQPESLATVISDPANCQPRLG